MPADKFLPAIGHAVSGATGTAISTTITYPLDLVNTRLKVQGQLRKDGAILPSEEYQGLADAFSKIFEREGGLRAFYQGLGSDVAKSVADSFLFFLFYTWFRTRRSHGNSRRLPVWEELAVGAAAGACARLLTTPISNVVTRKQTAALVTDDSTSDGRPNPTARSSFGEIMHVIRAEKGFTGLWAGYGATLVLTLNPSITFYLQHALKKAFVDRGREGESGGMVFLVAALSKVVATAITYPFNIAKVRAQVSAPSSPTPEPEKVASESIQGQNVAGKLRRLAQGSIFGALVSTARTEGIKTLYDGISGEILKAFFNHGTTMLSKDIAHGFIVRLYFLILELVRRSPTTQSLLLRSSEGRMNGKLGEQMSGRLVEMRDGVLKGAVVMSIVEWTQRRMIVAR
ncbi:unnamed protein product [Discula destructiva]